MRGAVVLVALQLAAGKKTCDRTYRLGAQHAAAPSSVSMMTSGFDNEGACVAFYDQPSGVIALERVEAGYLDMAFVGSVPYAAAAARGAQITAVANPITVLESSLRVMEMFRANQTSVLITTAAATRGLDFPQVPPPSYFAH